MYKIFSNYRRVYVTRNDQVTEVANGEMISAEEFATMSSEGNVECVDQDTNTLVVYTAGNVPVVAAAPAPVQTDNTPAPDAGLVPAAVDSGKKSSKA